MTGVGLRMVTASRLRRRAWELVALAILVGLSGTVFLAALAGARRTSTAVERALDRSNTADVSFDVATVDPATRAEIEALPEVQEISAFEFVALRPAGTQLVGGLDLVGVLPLDPVATRSMDRPKLLAGRLPSPERSDEVALSPGLARELGVGLGDPLRLEAYAQDQVSAIFSEGGVEPAGALLDASVVGIALPLESINSEQAESFGVVLLSHAVWREHGAIDDIEHAAGGDVGAFRLVLRARLHDGAAHQASFLRGAFGIYGDRADTTFSEARPDVFRSVADTTRVEAIATLLFAVAAAAAGVVALGQTASREATLGLSEEGPTLRAMGMRRRDVAVAAVAPVVTAVVAGAALAVAGSVAASRWLPRGLAGAIEPDPGADFDAAVLLGGAVLLVAVLVSRSVLAVRRADRAGVSSRRSAMAGQRPSTRMGVAMALRSRATLVTTAVAVVGVVGALAFSSSLRNLATAPRLYGNGWDVLVLFQTEGERLTEQAVPGLVGDDRLDGLAHFERHELAVGDDRISGIALRPLQGSAQPTVLEGALPVAEDEIAVDPRALDSTHVSVGDEVAVSTGGEPAGMTVVGLLTGTGYGEFVITDDAADALGAEPSDEGFFVRVAPGADVEAVAGDLRGQFVEVEVPRPPARVENLDAVRGFPHAVAGLLAALGVAAAGHLLLTSVRQRRREFAVLKALGFTSRQVWAAVAWSATTVGLVAVAVGVPLGLAAGRLAWTPVTRALGVLDAPVVPLAAVGVVVLSALVLVNVLGVLAGRSAAHTRPADVLRTE